MYRSRHVDQAAVDHAQLCGRGERQIDHVAFGERSAVVDDDLNAAMGLGISDV